MNTKAPRSRFDFRQAEYAAAAMMFPALAVIALTVLIPAVLSFALSFTSINRYLSGQFVGLANYRYLLTDPLMIRAMLNTFLFTAVFVPLNLVLAITVAMTLDTKMFGVRAIRMVFLTPIAVSGIVAVSIFRFVLDLESGPVNALLTSMGFEPVAWLGSAPWAMTSMVLIVLYKSVPFFGLILLASLQQVPETLREAAGLDGAGTVGTFVHVTLPSIRPVLGLVVTLSAIGAFRVFEPMFVLTDGGPSDSTLTLTLMAYRSAFGSGEIGVANAVCFVLLAAILIFSVVASRVAHRLGGEA